MSSNSVLLTGATGSVGAHVLQQLLEDGHSVTAVVRSLKKPSQSLSQKCASSLESGKFTIAEVPDLTVPHAFDKLARTVDAIIHVATPLSNGDFQNTVIDPTWTIDESILSAAAQAPSVKRVIITGSIVSTMMIPDDLFKDVVISEKSFNIITDKEPIMSPAGSYMYAKTAAEKKAWAWMEANKPKFDLVVLLAPSITGRCIQEGFVPVKSALGGMGDIYRNLFDVKTPGFLFPYFMQDKHTPALRKHEIEDVEDVAAIHVRTLDVNIPGNKRYLFHAGPLLKAQKVANQIRETYPQLRSRVPEGGAGDELPIPLVKVDISEFENVFGTQWKGWWESAKGTVDDILRLEVPVQ